MTEFLLIIMLTSGNGAGTQLKTMVVKDNETCRKIGDSIYNMRTKNDEVTYKCVETEVFDVIKN